MRVVTLVVVLVAAVFVAGLLIGAKRQSHSDAKTVMRGGVCTDGWTVWTARPGGVCYTDDK